MYTGGTGKPYLGCTGGHIHHPGYIPPGYTGRHNPGIPSPPVKREEKEEVLGSLPNSETGRRREVWAHCPTVKREEREVLGSLPNSETGITREAREVSAQRFPPS